MSEKKTALEMATQHEKQKEREGGEGERTGGGGGGDRFIHTLSKHRNSYSRAEKA